MRARPAINKPRDLGNIARFICFLLNKDSYYRAGLFVSNTNICIKVSTGKKEFALKWSETDNVLFVETIGLPKKGEANKEILKKLIKFFGTETYLVSGLTSRKKILKIELPKEQVLNILEKCKNQKLLL